MSTIINNNAITKMYKGDTPIYSFSINNGGGTGSGLDFSLIGYDTELTKQINDVYNADIIYTKQLLDEWDKETTSTNSLYSENILLKYAPNINTSNVTDMNNMFYNCSSLEFTPTYNTSNVLYMTNMFAGCANLKLFSFTDTSNVVDMSSMFTECKLLTTIPEMNTSNVVNMSSMFYACSSLIMIPPFNTSNVTNMANMFVSCSSLTTIPEMDTSNVNNMYYMFNGCSSLTALPLLDTSNITNMRYFIGNTQLKNLTDIGGFKDLKISVTQGFLDKAPNLTVESLMNVINNVYDLTANGLSGQSLKFGQTNLDKLTPEQIAVATAKGWTLTA